MNTKRWIAAVVAAAALGGLLGGLFWSRRGAAPSAPAEAAARYYCPMHPEYTSDKPGDCPICNMSLVKADQASPAAPPTTGDTTLSGKRLCVLHKCTMAGCKMELPLKPGETVSCPVCGTHVAEKLKAGEPLYYRHPMQPQVTSAAPKKDEMGMDYIPVYAEDVQASGGAFPLPEERRRMIGMTTGVVERRELAATVRASGRIAYDPDLFNAITEYRSALKAREQVRSSAYADARERADALVRASVLRLRQMGLSAQQIEALGASEEPPTNLLIGEAGGTVWAYAQVYEYEIGLVKPGQAVRITTPAYPGQTFRGTVRAVDPILDPQTRSLKARIEVPNPDGKLKLEMFIDAQIQVPLGRQLAVPVPAVLDTGTRQLVFVDLGDGRIEPREVRVGRQTEDHYEVLEGLREGERVVTSANFLIDSESRLKSAISNSEKKKGGGAKPQKPEAPPSEHRH